MLVPIMLSTLIVSAGLALGTYAIMRICLPEAFNELFCLIIVVTYIVSVCGVAASLIILAVYAVNGLLF